MNFDISLYLVTDSTYHTEESFLDTIESACAGGVTFLQLREKNKGGREYLDLAFKVKKITDSFNIPLIIDDRIDIALAVDAAGVHVGADDIPVEYARKILGENKIVGATAKTVENAKKAVESGADYIGTGAIFPTTTKVKTKLTKVTTLNEICKAVSVPVVAIGGLNIDNIGALDNSPVDGVAVVSALMKASDPKAAANTLKNRIVQIINNNKE